MQTQAHPKKSTQNPITDKPPQHTQHASQEPSIKGKKQETNQEKIPDPSPKMALT